MVDTTEIMNMLDWHMPNEIQSKGIALARNMETIIPFIQPLTPQHNKNVWDNCAIILAEKTDEEISPYLYALFDWLQDMNWPGADCILNRLKEYNDDKWLNYVLNDCINKAILLKEENWLNILQSISKGK
mgnify:CR=1 FL=1